MFARARPECERRRLWCTCRVPEMSMIRRLGLAAPTSPPRTLCKCRAHQAITGCSGMCAGLLSEYRGFASCCAEHVRNAPVLHDVAEPGLEENAARCLPRRPLCAMCALLLRASMPQRAQYNSAGPVGVGVVCCTAAYPHSADAYRIGCARLRRTISAAAQLSAAFSVTSRDSSLPGAPRSLPTRLQARVRRRVATESR